MKPSPSLLLVLCFFCVSIQPAWADRIEPATCMKRVTPLLVKRERVAELDGIWGQFQKTTAFQDNSVQGIQLDNKINTILYHLEYLCNTIDGIPFDELSDYVSTSLAEKGAENFKKELIILVPRPRQWINYFCPCPCQGCGLPFLFQCSPSGKALVAAC